MTATIQGLWIGPELTAMERLSIRSFLHHGHGYHLYVYDEVRGVPDGVRLEDAGRVLPASMIFRYREEGSYAGFANFFRYKLLLDRGGWWADTDLVCLRPFSFEDEHVFSSEAAGHREVVNNGAIKVRAGGALMADAWRACQLTDPGKLKWGETGPKLLAELIERDGLSASVQPARVFCPLGWRDWRLALDPARVFEFEPDTHAVHLWNEMWRRAEMDKNRRYHPDCLYERLKRQYGVE